MSESLDLLGDPEDTDKPLDTDRAYASSAGGREFQGIRLEGWSGRRRAAAFEIGFSGAGSVVDPVRVIYTCAISLDEVGRIFRSPSMATEAFLQWAEKHECLDPGMPNWDEAMQLANGIINEVEKSEFKVDDDSPGSGHLGNSTGQQS